MRRRFWPVVGLAFLIGISPVLGSVREAAARVSVNINIGAPPAFVLPAPPEVAVIPGTYVYFIPGIAADILFYHGYWYRPYDGHWFFSLSYNGPWEHITVSSLPRPLIALPPDYRSLPPASGYIVYGQLERNWRRWERGRYWDRDRDWRRAAHERHDGREEWHGERHEGYEGHGGRAWGEGHEEHGDRMGR